VWCSLWGTDWILKYYLDELWLHIFVVFLGPRTNAELVPKFHVTLHDSHAAVSILTHLYSLLHLSSLPSSLRDVLPPFQAIFTRKTSGHCMGPFISVNLVLSPPPPVKCGLSHYPPIFSSSASTAYDVWLEINAEGSGHIHAMETVRVFVRTVPLSTSRRDPHEPASCKVQLVPLAWISSFTSAFVQVGVEGRYLCLQRFVAPPHAND
jgi:hypothetical protein